MTFSYGDRVIVKSVPSKYEDRYSNIKGATGTVKSNYGSSIAVLLDDYENPASASGYFYFSSRALELKKDELLDFFGPGEIVVHGAHIPLEYIKQDIEATHKICETIEKNKEENDMPIDTNTNATIPMLPNFRVAGCIYPDVVKSYAFALYEDDVAVGDKVVVRNSGGALQIVEVESIGELPKDRVKNGCEVICKIDLTNYMARKEKAAQIHELKKEMDAKVAQLQAVALYELMAEKDPALKAMLAEFKALTE